MTSIRIVISIAASQGWQLYQMDVKNTFLHGDLKEKGSMTPPPNVITNSSSDVFKLKSSLYGLKQTPRAWFDKFQAILL